MGSIPNEFPISLRSWPSANTADPSNALATFAWRLRNERDGLRMVSEDGLRTSIAQAELNNYDEDDDDKDSTEPEEEKKLDRETKLMNAKNEMLSNIHQAQYAVTQALDFTSLIISKHQPIQASVTMDPNTKAVFGVGTMGIDKLGAPLLTNARREDNERVARGWKARGLSKAVDSILHSATRLEKEMETETKYWEQVLAVSENRWAVCRLPKEKQTLGVRFGFQEGASMFTSQSLAALRKSQDGTVAFDQGVSASAPQCLRVRIQHDGVDTGSSTVPQIALDDAPIESVILEARNTIFAEELWHELNREARSLGMVQTQGNTLICPVSQTKNVLIDLVPLEKGIAFDGPDKQLAEGIYLGLCLLLCSAHRAKLRRRTAPPPPITTNKPQALPYSLLRSLLTRQKHQETIGRLKSTLVLLCQVLNAASIEPHPSYTLKRPDQQLPSHLSRSERAMMALIDGLEAVAKLTITEKTTFTIVAKTHSYPISSYFRVALSPDSPLHTTFPPPPQGSFSSFNGVREYLFYATAAALASTLVAPVSSLPASNSEQWTQTAHANVLSLTHQSSSRTKQLLLNITPRTSPSVNRTKTGVRLLLCWEWLGGDMIRKELDGDKGGIIIGKPEPGRGGNPKKEGEGMCDWVAYIDDTEQGGDVEIVPRTFKEVVQQASR